MYEDLWQVKISDNNLVITDPQQNIQMIQLSNIQGIVIRTDDSGPVGSDVFWFISDGSSLLSFPMGARGEAKVLDAFQKIEGFDNAEFIKAMGSVDNKLFYILNRAKE